MLIRREEVLLRLVGISFSMPDKLDVVECDQRLMLRLSDPDLFSSALLGRLREVLVRPEAEDGIGRGSGLVLPFLKGRLEPDRDESDAAFLTVTTDEDVEFDLEALL